MPKFLTFLVFYLLFFAVSAHAQTETPTPQTEPSPQSPKKANSRPADKSPKEPFDNATVTEMAAQCVRLNTEKGSIELELFPESAPETVRNFLNLVSISAFDTTVFSRVVPDFVVQGGNITTRENLTQELFQRSRRTIPDEPGLIKHERGIVSMARPDQPNSATSHFFILLGEAPHLDNKFAAFGRVTSGMDVVEAINKMPVEGEKPVKPVRLNKAVLVPCSKTENQ